MQYHEVKINLELSSFASMITTNALSGGQVSVSGGSIGYASLWCDYIYLDTDERRRFAQVSHEYLKFDWVQKTFSKSERTSRAQPCKVLSRWNTLTKVCCTKPYWQRYGGKHEKLGKVTINMTRAISVLVTSWFQAKSHSLTDCNDTAWLTNQVKVQSNPTSSDWDEY